MSTTAIPFAKKKKLRTLIKRMSKQNLRQFPFLPPLLDVFDLVLTSEELDYLLRIGIDAMSYEQAASLASMPEGQFKIFFDTLLRKGFIHPHPNSKDQELFALSPVAVGWYETQVHYLVNKPEEKEFSKRFDDVFKYVKRLNLPVLRTLQNAIAQPFLIPNQRIGIVEALTNKKRIEIGESVTTKESTIYPAKTVEDIIQEFGDKNLITVAPCVCRHSTALLDDPCRLKLPKESCIVFGPMGEYWAKFGYGRYISKEEARDIIQEVRDKGAVHSVMHDKDDTSLSEVAICNCCWDCCAMLRNYNRGAFALKYVRHYMAEITDPSACIGCGKCEKHCPTTAATLVDKKVSIKPDICIGCGQCVHQCPEKNVLTLTPSEKTVFLPIIKKSEARIKT